MTAGVTKPLLLGGLLLSLVLGGGGGISQASAAGMDPGMDHGAIGEGDLDHLIAIAKQMSPELAAAALESDAAAAKVAGADSLPDPKLQWQAMDIPRDGSNYLPGRLPKTDKFFLQQDFPLWGKRDLKREIAVANSQKAAALRVVAEAELIARVKAAYAQYHQIHQAIDLDQELLPRLSTIAKLAGARYGQGVGKQQEATGAEIERTELVSELVRLDAERRKAKVRLNSLVGRDGNAPIDETPHLRPIPADLELGDLTDRADRLNPELRAQNSEIEAADGSVTLAEKSWYPDLGVSVGAVKANGRFDGYEAMLEVNIPIRGGLRDADIGEAKAMSGAVKSKRRAKELEIQSALSDAYWNLEAARKMEKLMLDSSLPQARVGFESAAHAYELGKGEFAMVLSAEQQWRKTHLAHLQAQLEQQMGLAEIEKLIGGDL
ncbi:TolC family protein [Telmatospirillum sp.]|uniref:TolC family protein n=1 Tax=Telmatospirillum sp. TaxID=2079197 RepID=UPI0028426312|nr:TolC family protein [Telmatospirillum sp.]MDR3435770.1 TolC family protein [Telmatospirillum sp.]